MPPFGSTASPPTGSFDRVAGHLSRNRGRYAAGAAGTIGGLIFGKSLGKVAGGRGVDRRDPHYDMNYRSGQSQFHKRRRSFSETSLLEPGAHVVFPAAAGATGGALVLRRVKKGYDEGRYNARQAGTQKGYEDEHRRFYGRRRESQPLQEFLGMLVARGSRPGGISTLGNKAKRRAGFDAIKKGTPTMGQSQRAAQGRAGILSRARKPGRRIGLPKLGLKTKIGLGAAAAGAAYGTYKGTKEVYKKVTEAAVPGSTVVLDKSPKLYNRSAMRRQAGMELAKAGGLGIGVLGGALAARQLFKGNRKESHDPFIEDALSEIAAPGHVMGAARKMGPVVKWGSRGLIAADVAMLGHAVSRDRRDKKTPVHKAVRESVPQSAGRVVRAASSGVPMLDRALVAGSLSGSVYYKTKDYQDKKLLKKVSGGRIDRSKE